jgi:hypothetical protein
LKPVIKIALYGDSLAAPRQGVVASDSRYLALLEKHIRRNLPDSYIEIRDKAKGGFTISQLFSEYCEDNTYYELPGHILIIHAGIVDCAPRPVNDKLRNRIARLPGFLKKISIRFLHQNRARIIKSNGGFVKTDINLFKSTFMTFIRHSSSNFEKVFVINICPTNEMIERHSPGLTNNINVYNNGIKDTLNDLNLANVFLIDVHQMISGEMNHLDDYVVKGDGHHIHSKTHEWIAHEMIQHLKR